MFSSPLGSLFLIALALTATVGVFAFILYRRQQKRLGEVYTQLMREPHPPQRPPAPPAPPRRSAQRVEVEVRSADRRTAYREDDGEGLGDAVLAAAFLADEMSSRHTYEPSPPVDDSPFKSSYDSGSSFDSSDSSFDVGDIFSSFD